MADIKKKVSVKGIWKVLKSAFTGFSDDRVMKLSGSLAYYTVFSMGPLLVVIISLCGLFLGREAVEGKIYGTLQGFVGQDTAIQLQEIIRNASVGNKSKIAAIVGFITLLIGATSIFAEIQDSINSIWGLKPKPKRGWVKMLQNRFLSFSVIISLGFLLLVSLGISTIIEGVSGRLQAAYPEVTVITFYVFNLVLTLVITAFIFAVIFKVLPDAMIRWRDVATGSIVTALLFLIGKAAIGLYISQSNVGSTYGTAGSLVVVLIWVYYSSMILYFGAEFTKAYAMEYGAPIHPNKYAVTMQQVEVETGNATVQAKEEHVEKVVTDKSVAHKDIKDQVQAACEGQDGIVRRLIFTVMPDTSQKVAVITGAGSGLGRALALELFSRGFQLALLDIDQAGLEDFHQPLSGKSSLLTIHHTDISKEQDVIATRRDILQQHGHIDLLINNAGVSISQPFEEMANADFRALFEINFWGMVYCTRNFLPDLRNVSDGHIVNIVSGFALMGFPGKTAYASSKAAITGFTHSLKTELAGSSVRISLVIPPPLNTHIVAAGKHGSEEKRAEEAAFLAKNGMPLAKAASIIAAQVLKGKYRIVVGGKAKLMDLAVRLFPTVLHRFIGKYKRRFPFV